MQLAQHGCNSAGEGAGAEVVRHLVPAPGVGTNPRRRVRPISRGRSGAGSSSGSSPCSYPYRNHGQRRRHCRCRCRLRRRGAWAPLLTELARQLDTGRIYTRDLNAILPTFDEALQALNRRLTH